MSVEWPKFFSSKDDGVIEINERTLQQLWDEVDANPFAGLGIHSKRAQFFNRVVELHVASLAQKTGIMPKKPAPIMVENNQPVPTPLQMASAKAAKAAGM